MENKASITALMSAFARAYHAEHSESPVFDDTLARRLMTDGEYEQIKKYILGGIDFFAPEKKDTFKNEEEALKYIVETQLAPTPLARARFCEESLKTAVMTGTVQYVILGAGLDTFAFREKELMKKITVFEADHPLTQEDKKARIRRAGWKIPENLKFVPVDFTKDDLRKKLTERGFDAKKKTFFSWLGVSYYLNAEQVGHLLESISAFAAEGSSLLFDFADSGLFGSQIKRVRNMLAMASAGGEPMKFCTDYPELALMCQKHNFLIYELLSPEDIQNAYFCGRKDNLSAFEHISYALAVLKGTRFRNTKEDILLEALKLFSEKGYDAVSVRDIAGRLEITQAALYKHYKNKRDIFDSIVKRMAENDFERAAAYGVPEEEFSRGEESYRRTSAENIKQFAFAQFRYWTEDDFASAFRKMLTLEQYKSREMSAMYQNYLSGGVINYLEDIFRENGSAAGGYPPKRLALEFYAPVYMLMNMYDAAENKEEITELAHRHIENFEI